MRTFHLSLKYFESEQTSAKFTDGVSEAANAEQEEFGEDRLTTLLRGSSAESAEALQSRVMHEVTQFCANRFQDDATVVVLVVEARAASAAGAA